MIDRSKAPDVRPFGKLNIPQEKVEVLPSGVTLHTLNGGDQAVTRLIVMWKGSNQEAATAIIPTLTTELLREGSKNRTGAEIADKLDLYGAILGSTATSHYSYLTLAMLNNKAHLVMPVLSEIFTAPTFPEQALNAIKTRTINKFKLSRQQVGWMAGKKMIGLIAGEDHPLSRTADYDAYEAVTRDDIVDYYAKAFQSRGVHIYASGQITDEILALINQFAEQIPVGDGYELNFRPLSPLPPQTVYTERKDSLQCAVAMAVPAIHRSHEDYLPLQLTATALGGYFGSRLMMNIREEKGYTYGISTGLNGLPEGSYVAITAQCDPAYTDALIGEVKNELRRMVSDPPCGDELRRMTLNAASKLADTLESPFSIMDFYKLKLLVDIPDGYFEKRQQAIAELTPEKIAEMSAKYLNPDDLRISIAGPQKQ